MMNRLNQTLRYILLVPAVLPLVYISGILYPYVAPKTFLLQGSGIVALALFAYLALAGQSFFYGRLRAFATWIPALLLFVAYITSFFGVGFYQSFWGLFARGDGLLTLSVITLFFYLIVLCADRPFLERLAKTVTAVAGIVAAIAVLQWVTTLFGEQASFLPPVSGRIGSTLGNAAFLASYLGMAFFVSLVVLRDARGAWRRISKITAVLSLLAILFTATRGTIMALLLAGGVALVATTWKGEGKVKNVARYGLMALVIFAGLFFLFRTELSQSSFEPVQRIASISLSDETVSSRLFVWSHLLTETLQRPFSGYGAEHIAQLFDKVYDPSKILEQWFDRSHNAFLDYGAQYGIFGFAFYLALIGAFLTYAIRLHRREEGRLITSGFLFSLLIVTYAAQNFFVFDTPVSLWLLYALFALCAVLVLDDADATPLSLSRVPRIVPWVVAVLIALCIVPAVITPLRANLFLTQGYTYHLIDVQKANAYFERGLALHTYAGLEYGYQAYDMYTGHQVTALAGENRVAAYTYALSVLTANFNTYPYDARTATYLGHVLDTAPPEVTVDDTFDQTVLSRAISLSPLRAQAWYMDANIYLRNADALPVGDPQRTVLYRKATAVLEEYAQKETSLSVARYTLATLYYNLGDTATAQKWADEAYPLYTSMDGAAARPAVKYYLAVKDWKHAARFLSDLSQENPTDYNTLYDLAKVTYLAGDLAAADRIVVRLRIEDPAILATDQNFLAAITAYESR
ncbi:MAG: O-antigen ligase family protein [Patescibacteria group bacterium]|nr:O-antigen ligase family protein [Patescibacteria group bacterium]